MDLVYLFGLIALVLMIAAGVVYIVYRERSHASEILKLLGITDNAGNPTPAKATAALAVGSIGEPIPGPVGPEGPAGKDGKDATLPPGTIIIPPTTAQYAAIMSLAPDAVTIQA